MIQSIHFIIKKWDYNKKAPLTNTHTDCTLRLHPLRPVADPTGKAAGLTFIWTLVLTGEGLEILYYSSQESFIIQPPVLIEPELLEITKQSYERSSYEVAMRNLAVGLDAGFPAFETIPMDVKALMNVIDM